MSKIWSFVGGVVTGVAGIVATAFIVSKLDAENSKDVDFTKEQEQEILALPEGKD